ncbi:MAG: AAA family ATPase [Bacillota bacterium]
MAKMSIIVADVDKNYINAFAEFINADYEYKFNSVFFTEYDKLLDYLDRREKSPEVLLLEESLLSDEIFKYGINTVLVLSDHNSISEDKKLRYINKYRSGEDIVSDLLEAYSNHGDRRSHTIGSEKKVKLIAVYSPTGGSGKTSIAVGLSMISADSRYKTLYLNLEYIQSTQAFFDCSKSRTITELCYYIKEQDPKLQNKLAGMRTVDSSSGVHFIGAAGSAFDMLEVSTEEITQLIFAISQSDDYDFIFVDLPSVIDLKTIEVLDVCNRIVLVHADDNISKQKQKLFKHALLSIGNEYHDRIIGKSLSIINKSKANDRYEDAEIVLPFFSDLVFEREDKLELNFSSGFGYHVEKIFTRINNM